MIRTLQILSSLFVILFCLHCSKPQQPAVAGPAQSEQTAAKQSTSPDQLPTAIRSIPEEKSTSQSIVKTAHQVAGYHIELQSGARDCRLVYSSTKTPDPKPKELTLQLEPPCYWQMWPYKPRIRKVKRISDGIPVGEKDQPMAWKYKSANSTTIAVIIGGIPEERDPKRLAKLKEHKCGSHSQGILISDASLQLSKEVHHGSVRCANTGVDEKEFWLFAHDK